jgi:hypothetical protein
MFGVHTFGAVAFATAFPAVFEGATWARAGILANKATRITFATVPLFFGMRVLLKKL